jgi:hypothetical protein
MASSAAVDQHASAKYKSEQEAFVTGLTGTTASDVMVCLLHVPVLVLLALLVQHTFISNIKSQQSVWPCIAIELAVLVIPLLLVMTIWADYHHITLPVLCAIIVLLLLYVRYYHRPVGPPLRQTLSVNALHDEKQTPSYEKEVTGEGDKGEVMDNTHTVLAEKVMNTVMMRKTSNTTVNVSATTAQQGSSSSTIVKTTSIPTTATTTANTSSNPKPISKNEQYFVTLFKGKSCYLCLSI